MPVLVAEPGLSVVTAPALEPLFEHLVEVLQRDPLDPLQTETIVIARNVGLRAWLTDALARRLGCAASLDLPAPVSLVARLAGISGGAQPYEAGPLAWRLRPLLDAIQSGDDPDPVYAPLRAYLARTGGGSMPLATRLASLFDDYQVYRPDVLTAWSDGRDPFPDFAHGAWQAALWRRLRDDGLTDRATAFAALEERLASADPRLPLPERLSVFGSLVFPTAYYRVIAGIARHRPVTFYTVAAGTEPTTDPHAHPLLRALAGETRQYWRILRDLGAPPPERIVSVRLGTEAEGATALHQLQRALATDTVPAAPVPLDLADRSVRIHDCHSPTRELEVLRDSLLDAFAEVDGLRPADVLVVLPDLDTYAPLVDAVFGAEDAAPELRIPYHVAEHPHAPALRVVEAFARALRLHEGRVTASDLLDLLGTPVVRRAAGITEEELPMLRTWIRESGVCWGLSADRKTRFGLPEDDLNTWRFGLDRLLLGVMTGEPDGGLVLGHLPCDVAGLGGADLLGRFCEWAEALFVALDALDRPAPLDAWPSRLVQFLDGVFRAETDEEIEAVVFLREQAQRLAELDGLAGASGDAVSFRTVRAHIDGAADAFEVREPYLTGRVTFARPLALSHAPHRVVAFVGLNDGTWPRPELVPDFDLLAHDPRPGDRAPRDLDKQLFVDAVLAARDRLILSYVGRSQKDNAERAASVCLDAFQDAARRHWGPEADRLVVEHRLQPFAADYFRLGAEAGGVGLPASYAAQHRVTTVDPAGSFFAKPLPDLEIEAETITLAELAAAWTNPSRFVVRRRLRASLDLDDGALRDDEPIELDALEQYHVREAALVGMLDGLAPDALAERLRRSGRIPAGAPGASVLAQACEEALPIAQDVASWGATDPLAVALEIEDVRLVGTLERTTGRGALRFRAGKIREKHLIEAWIDHLALCATRPDGGVTCTLGADGTSKHFAAVPPEDALAWLGALVKGYKRARRGRLPLYEKASHAYAKKMSDGQLAHFAAATAGRATADEFHPNDAAMRDARKNFSDAWNDFTDDADAYVQLATRGLDDPFVPEAHFAKWALGLWAPLLTHVREGVPV